MKDLDTNNREYWETKCVAYLHDPIDKALYIPKHLDRAQNIANVLGFQMPNEEYYKQADIIASGFERGQFPGYKEDESKSGAVSFFSNPKITHPISIHTPFELKLPKEYINRGEEEAAKKINEDIVSFLSNEFKNKQSENHPTYIKEVFSYIHFALRVLLAEQNIGGLGALWHKIPADTRIPDHSIWNHNALTSAIYSCIHLSGSYKKVGMMVFSIGPVQSFISTARKLRDFWTGSVLLSWLAFEGIRWIMENLGPDHVLYPSLVDQPLVNTYLNRDISSIDVRVWKKQPKRIASLPNKFVFLLPIDNMEYCAEEIKKAIKKKWNEVKEMSMDYLTSYAFHEQEKKMYLKQIFDRQMENFWEFRWAGVRLVESENKDNFNSLLPKDVIDAPLEISNLFENISSKKDWKHYSIGQLYSISHSLTQAALAASKAKREVNRPKEPGEKCIQCGEFEVLHDIPHKEGESVQVYKDTIKSFWKKAGKDNALDLKDNERLCSLCYTKRIAYRLFDKTSDHILHDTFQGIDSFPSTTRMSLYNWYKRERIIDEDEKIREAEKLHKEKITGTDNRDRYYAILLMDGDKMGDLVGGKNIDALWETVLHPKIIKKLQSSENDIENIYVDIWNKIFNHKKPAVRKRLLSPATHSAISEALTDFSLYGVDSIVKKHEGKLIYAGGDDVCAIMPVDTALPAAMEIQQYYNSFFNIIEEDENISTIKIWEGEKGKLSIGLGNGEKISISGGILICHHKEDLKSMIVRAHSLLDKKAKEEAGRNACAIELKKRSGGSRYFVRKWNEEETWEAFQSIGNKIKTENKREAISSSLVYRLEQFRIGIEELLNKDNFENLTEKFLLDQIKRSGFHIEMPETFAKQMRLIAFQKETNNGIKQRFTPEGLIIAGFIQDKGGQSD